MKGLFLKYFVLILLPLGLLCSCQKNEQSVEVSGKVTATIPFTATVYGTPETRASVSGDALGNGCYIFEAGDKLYVEHKESGDYKVYGVLDLIEGDNTGSAVFTGELNCLDNYTIEDGVTTLSVTLVGSSAPLGFFTFSDLDEDSVNDVVSAVNYPATIAYASLADQVRRYSQFTGNTTFSSSGNTFTLTQQSVFLNFELYYFYKNDPNAITGTVFLYADDGLGSPDISSLRLQINDVPIGSGAVGNAIFTAVVQAGSALSGAHILIDDDTSDSNAPLEFTPSITNQTLAINNYYSIARSRFDGFKIKAAEATTTIWFNYFAEDDGIQYSRDGGRHWIPYTSQDNIVLEKDEEICVVGNRANYKNEKKGDQWWTPDDKPIFRASSKCYISGNVMSLLSDKVNLVESAFQGAFSRGSTAVDYIDIHPDYPLYLPATSLASRCYMQMFRNCTYLTHAPTFRAESVAEKSCYNMFRQCSSLVDVSTIELPATTLAVDCYRELFRQCSNLASAAPTLPAPTLVKECYRQMFANTKITSLVCLATDITAENCTNEWMASVTNNKNRTFYKASTMESWSRDSHGIPDKWTVTDYVPPIP